MWSLMLCLRQGHVFVNITCDGVPYEYCLRCGKVRTARYPVLAAQAIGPAEKLESVRPN